MKEKIPNTLNEAIEMLIESDANPDNVSGMGMRNGWGLWGGSKLAQWFYRHKIYHADDMSAIIIESYSRVKAGEDIKLNEQINFYHNFWKDSQGPNHLSEMKKMVMDNLIKMRADNLDEILKEMDIEDKS